MTMLSVMDSQLLGILAFALTFVAVVGIGGAIVLARAGIRRKALGRLAEPGNAAEQPTSTGGKFLNIVSKIGLAAKSNDASPALRKKLACAAYYKQSAPAIFIGVKLILLMVGLVSLPILLIWTNLAVHIAILSSLTAAMLLSMIPNMMLSARRKSRSAEVR